jgi:protein-S-isoprenylcysteine O-methyltransferase Ste14
MRDWQWRKYWASAAGGVLLLTQIALWIAWGGGDVAWLALTGVALWVVGVVFALVPILQFKRRGGVAKGESYVKTTVIVDSGVYAVVRHPQFISWPMFSVALMLMTQQWLVVVLGALSILLFCLDFRTVDERELAKFGDAYRDYITRVPGWNPLVGIWRWFRRKAS